jgi:hypothetical protein
MALVITGLLNRQDAFDGESASSRVMRRMQAESIVDLAEMAMKRRLGQMSRLFDADPIAGRDDYPRKYRRPCSCGPNYQLCLARWSIIVGKSSRRTADGPVAVISAAA